MKAITATVLILAICSGIRAQEITAISQVTDVTVYRTLARESRSATVSIPKGNHDVVLSRISTLMTDASLLVSVKGNATLLTASVRTNYFTEQHNVLQNPKAERLRDSIRVLETDLGWIGQQQELLSGEMALVAEYLKPNPKEPVKPADLMALADFYRNRFTELKKKQFDLSLKAARMHEQKNRFEGQLNEMSANKTDPAKEIVLSFSSETGGSLQLECSYLVSSAGWTPMYDVKVENTAKPVLLDYKARLFQKTGYDWKNVRITVSTANPSRDNNRPLLRPRYIGYVTYNFRTAGKSEEGVLTNMMQAEKVTSDREINYPVGVNESGIQIEYRIDARQSIPSTGREHVCRLQHYTVPVTYRYHAVPKLDPGAFLLARITGYEQYNLLAGTANIFFGDTYVGQTQINPEITADTLLLSLGRDERIVVKRVRVQDKNTRKLLNDSQKDTYVWETTIRNNKDSPVDIEILDQVPLSRHNEIEVELVNHNGAEYDKTYGKLLWNLRVQPGETKKIRFEYTIKYPKGKQVQEQ